jgi:hypothetical protein
MLAGGINMTHSEIKQRILRQLERLPPDLQLQLLEFAEELAASRPRGVPGYRFLRFAGVLSQEEAQAMRQAIEAGCERIDLHEW